MIKNKYKIIDDYIIIYVIRRNGQIFEVYIDLKNLKLVDDIDSKIHVHYSESNKSWYARISKYLGIINGKAVSKSFYLSRYIMGIENSKFLIDHKDFNTLNNRENNLRIIDSKNNLKHRKDKNSNNTSGYRNVTWMFGYWRIQLQIDGKNHLFPDKFSNVDEAGMFASKMRKKYYKEDK